jgi:hypothetical protein
MLLVLDSRRVVVPLSRSCKEGQTAGGPEMGG